MKKKNPARFLITLFVGVILGVATCYVVQSYMLSPTVQENTSLIESFTLVGDGWKTPFGSIRSSERSNTVGWETFSHEYFSIKHPPHFIPQYLDDGSIQISELRSESPDLPYDPPAFYGVTILPMKSLPDCFGIYNQQCGANDPLDADFDHEFYLPEWKEMFKYRANDGNSANEAVIYKTSINRRPAVHSWFTFRSGLEGHPRSQNNLIVWLDDTRMIPFLGFSYNSPSNLTSTYEDSAEANFSIIETMYSTIEFH